MPRRIKPLMIAPLIPLLAIIGIFGVEQLHGSRFLTAFVVIWCAALAGLFAYALEKALEARRSRIRR